MRKTLENSGYTLIELMVTVAAVSVVMAFAVPNLGQFLERRQIQLQASRINDAFNLTRATALSHGQGASVCWNLGGPLENQAAANTIIVIETEPDGTRNVIKTVDIKFDGYEVSDTGAAGDCIDYNAQGRAANGVSFGVCKNGGNIDDLMTITVTNTGRPSITRADKSNPNPNNFVCS